MAARRTDNPGDKGTMEVILDPKRTVEGLQIQRSVQRRGMVLPRDGLWYMGGAGPGCGQIAPTFVKTGGVLGGRRETGGETRRTARNTGLDLDDAHIGPLGGKELHPIVHTVKCE